MDIASVSAALGFGSENGGESTGVNDIVDATEENTWNQGDDMAIVAEASEHSLRELSWNNAEHSRVNQYFQEVARDIKELGKAEHVLKGSIQGLIGEMVMKGSSFAPLTKKERISIKAKFIRFLSFVKQT